MNQQNCLFEDQGSEAERAFYDFALKNDKAGALQHLQRLPPGEIEKQVLEAGFSMIGRHHGKPALLEHAIEQIGKKTPRKLEY